MSNVVALRQPSTSRYVCSGCGVASSCNCGVGVPYIPAGEWAAKVVAKPENADKSNRALAAGTGLSENTLRRARASVGTAPNVAVGQEPAKRVGRDGKARRLPVKKTEAAPITAFTACTVEGYLARNQAKWWFGLSKTEWLTVAAKAFDAGYFVITRDDLKEYQPRKPKS